MVSFRGGNTVVSVGRFDFERMLKAIEKYRVTYLLVVPPIILALAKQQSLVKKFELSSLKQIGGGAAPMGKELMKECSMKFPSASVIQVS